jgi:hypothetical protein
MVCLFTVAMFFTLVPGKHRLDDLEFDHAIIRIWMCAPGHYCSELAVHIV